MAVTLQELADELGVTLVGDPTVEVRGCAPIESAGPDEVTFLANAKYRRFLEGTRAAAVIMSPGTPCPGGRTRLLAPNPYMAFRDALVALHGFRRHPERPADGTAGLVSERAVVHPDATVGEGTVVHPHAVVERGAVVGARCNLYPGAYVGPSARVGDDCVLYPNAVVYDRCVVGNRVTLHANTVIGNDGFGHAFHEGVHHKIPQTGIVVVEDDVEIGSCCSIERAALGETRIGKGTKFADLISIGHGTRIGEHCAVVSLVGVSGSVEVGNNVALAGQVGVVGHLKIGDGVQVAGKAAITHDVPPGMKMGGAPAVELDHAKRNALVGMDLYGLAKRLKSLERELRRLKTELVEPLETSS